jgi:hypothetical protein
VPASPQAVLFAFLLEFEAGWRGAPSTATESPLTDAESVVGFRSEKGVWRLIQNETDEVECKREVDLKKLASVVRAVSLRREPPFLMWA